MTRNQAKSEIEKLVGFFERNIHQLKSQSFNETKLDWSFRSKTSTRRDHEESCSRFSFNVVRIMFFRSTGTRPRVPFDGGDGFEKRRRSG
jgi:hypothetical protein